MTLTRRLLALSMSAALLTVCGSGNGGALPPAPYWLP
jgi:hypothetical protein